MARVIHQLQPGIQLVREVPERAQQVFYILNQKPSLLVMTIDIEGSVGTTIEGVEGTSVTVEIMPEESKLLAKLLLAPDARVRHKFSYLQKEAPPGSRAHVRLAEQEKLLWQRTEECKKLFATRDLHTCDESFLSSSSCGHFVDPYFPPVSQSITAGYQQPFTTPVEWRRPKEFFTGAYNVFLNSIEPNDIKQGLLGDCWLMCALASLAERPQLVERLFEQKEVSEAGLYRLKFYKNGELQTVTVDDYFPCVPFETPIFSRSHGNELWVLLVEKAYAKLHGSYMLLKGGWAHEGMLDLTGCPTLSYDFSSEEVKERISEDFLWPLLREFDQEAALISASTPGEDRWTDNRAQAGKGGLIGGHAYSVIQVREALGNRLLNIRNPWGTFEWEGEWSDKSPLWTDEMKRALKPVLEENDGTFWMCYSDFLQHFQSVNVCLVRPFFEARSKGYFQMVNSGLYDYTYSHCYYTLSTSESTRVYVGLHQEDERILGVHETRPNLDLGLILLEFSEGGLKFCKRKERAVDRQIEIELELKKGRRYLLLPITSGCKMHQLKPRPTEPLFENDHCSLLFRSTVVDLFRKSTPSMNEYMSYTEFSTLMRSAGVTVEKNTFADYLQQYSSSEKGLTREGFVDCIVDKARESEETMREWLGKWGYGPDLFSHSTRAFVLSVHAAKPCVEFTSEEAASPELSNRAAQIEMQHFGEVRSRNRTVEIYQMNAK